MSGIEELYALYAVALALQEAAKEPARPKAIMLPEPQPEPELPPEPCTCGPAPTLH